MAIWIDVSLKNLMKDTDYVVIASLSDIREWTRGNMDYGRGKLHVYEVLSPRIPTGQHLNLAWENQSGVVCPRVEHADTGNKKYIWLLERGKSGSVTADYPGRVLDLHEKKKVLKLLKYLPSPADRPAGNGRKS